jgi:hypothetical protein
MIAKQWMIAFCALSVLFLASWAFWTWLLIGGCS